MKYLIDREFDKVRIDRWVRNTYPNTPQSLIEKHLRSKVITVNNEKVKSSHRLKAGDQVEVRHLIEAYSSANDLSIKFNKADYDTLIKSIIFEHDDYIIFNKPSGFAVQGGSLVKKSVIDILKAHKPETNYKIVHRLDKDTSGILIVAKNLFAARFFADLFQSNNIKKTYHAIVQGGVRQKEGVMRNKLLKVNDRVVVCEEGKDSLTHYKLEHSDEKISLLKLEPKTGRMHQLRVQLANIGHPIIGDNKYNPDFVPGDQLMLHASQIEFVDFDNNNVTFNAPMPNSFSKFTNLKA